MPKGQLYNKDREGPRELKTGVHGWPQNLSEDMEGVKTV